MTNSKQKGKRGELEAAHALEEMFSCEVIRTQQYCGAAGDADLVGLPGVHIEVKRTEKLRLYDALNQAMGDAKGDDVPVVLHRTSRKEWVVIVRLDDLARLADAIQAIGEK